MHVGGREKEGRKERERERARERDGVGDLSDVKGGRKDVRMCVCVRACVRLP